MINEPITDAMLGLGLDEYLIRFPCESCGKLIGADPAMALVACGRCGLTQSVPERRAAELAQAKAIRLVAIELPQGDLWRMGLGLALMLTPLVGMLTVAACSVVLFARWVW